MHALNTSSRLVVQWSVVVFGVLIGMIVNLVMMLLSFVTDLSGMRLKEGAWSDVFVSWTVSLWQGFSLLIAAFLGAYIAIRVFRLTSKMIGCFHGFLVGTVMVLLFAIFSSTQASMWLGSVFHNAAFVVSRVSPLTTPPQSAARAIQLEMLLKANAGDISKKTITPQMIAEWRIQVEAGEREKAMLYLINNFGFVDTRAAVLTDQALLLTGNSERASPQARLRNQHNLKMLSDITWTMLIAIICSLLFAALGGMLGSIDDSLSNA